MSQPRPHNTTPVVDKETHVGDHLDETSSSDVGAVTTKRTKVRRHCTEWWWAYLLTFIALVVLIVCLM